MVEEEAGKAAEKVVEKMSQNVDEKSVKKVIVK